MTDAPERIWIDEWGGNWSPVAGGTQAHEYIRADLARPAPTLAEALALPEVQALVEALRRLHHAVCGETGFARCVRVDSGLEYPWPALDEADELTRAALARIGEGGE